MSGPNGKCVFTMRNLKCLSVATEQATSVFLLMFKLAFSDIRNSLHC